MACVYHAQYSGREKVIMTSIKLTKSRSVGFGCIPVLLCVI